MFTDFPKTGKSIFESIMIFFSNSIDASRQNLTGLFELARDYLFINKFKVTRTGL
jgi:hypothetical protein